MLLELQWHVVEGVLYRGSIDTVLSLFFGLCSAVVLAYPLIGILLTGLALGRLLTGN